MKRLDISVEDIATIHEQAQIALLGSRFDEAIELSGKLARMLPLCRLGPVELGDGEPRPYSVLVVGHRAVSEHADLVERLAQLDPARFEIVLVENAADPVFDLPEDRGRPNWSRLRLGRNLGIGVARNLGFLTATGQGVICLDDDGVTTTDAIESLVRTFERFAATAVRGRVVPRSPGSDAPRHYDLGATILRRHCDVEGMAIWNRRQVLKAGGFDPILYGHEGAELTARLYPLHGPEAFLYDPQAVLRHDYAASPEKLDEKKCRHDHIAAYLRLRNPDFERIVGAFKLAAPNLETEALLQARRSYAAARATPSTAPDVTLSVVATGASARGSLERFVGSLERQTDQDFELVVVDEGPEDGSAEALRQLLPSGLPLQIIPAAGIGRAEALDLAVAAASGDVCVIAGTRDLSLPHRLEWTREAYRRYPEADMIGFVAFDADGLSRAGRLSPLEASPIEVRALFGPPCPFPALSFRRTRLRQRFGPKEGAGFEAEWMLRCILEDGARGMLVPLNAVYAGANAGPIAAAESRPGQARWLGQVRRLHERLLGVEVSDDNLLRMFLGRAPIRKGSDNWRVQRYGLQLIQAIELDRPDLASARHDMSRHLASLHLGLTNVIRTRLETAAEQRDAALHEAQAQVEVERDRLAEAEAAAAELRHELGRIVALLEDETQAKRTAQEETAAERKHLVQLQSSLSWRMTAPLRKLRRWRKSSL